MSAQRLITVDVEEGEPKGRVANRTCMNAVTLGAAAAQPWVEKAVGPLDFNQTVCTIAEKAKRASDGDLLEAKQMLMAQAVTLDAIFNDMVRRGANLIRTDADGKWTYTAETMESVMRLAFKAQGQCQATLRTLGELVNPKSVAFIKQANVAHGHQQVNNGGEAVPSEPPRTRQTESVPNKLLEEDPSERLEFGAQGKAGRGNQELEAVGTIHRPRNGGGKVSRLPKRSQTR